MSAEGPLRFVLGQPRHPRYEERLWKLTFYDLRNNPNVFIFFSGSISRFSFQISICFSEPRKESTALIWTSFTKPPWSRWDSDQTETSVRWEIPPLNLSDFLFIQIMLQVSVWRLSVLSFWHTVNVNVKWLGEALAVIPQKSATFFLHIYLPDIYVFKKHSKTPLFQLVFY